MNHPWEIRIYETEKGKRPYQDWFESLESATQNMIAARLGRVRLGFFGDCQSVGDGVFELRFHHGSGYRVYFGKERSTIILLLCGGDKGAQERDIAKAKKHWREYKEPSNG